MALRPPAMLSVPAPWLPGPQPVAGVLHPQQPRQLASAPQMHVQQAPWQPSAQLQKPQLQPQPRLVAAAPSAAPTACGYRMAACPGTGLAPVRPGAPAAPPLSAGVACLAGAGAAACAPAQAATAAAVASAGAGAAPGAPRTSGVILCIGDSLTAGVTNTKDAYPAQLERFLREKQYSAFCVRNAGVYGEDCEKIFCRLQGAIADASRFGPLAYIFVLGGTNDLFQHQPAAVILQRLRRMHEACLAAPGAPCLAVLTVPRCGIFGAQQEQARLEINRSLAAYCQDAAPRRFLVDLDGVPVELAKDQVHYMGKGYEEFGRKAAESLVSLLSN